MSRLFTHFNEGHCLTAVFLAEQSERLKGEVVLNLLSYMSIQDIDPTEFANHILVHVMGAFVSLYNIHHYILIKHFKVNFVQFLHLFSLNRLNSTKPVLQGG